MSPSPSHPKLFCLLLTLPRPFPSTADYKVAKLIDFGLAASINSPTKELMRKVGTKKYRAPEVNGTTVQGFGVDIYSYGAMLVR